jgi:hypothetical protein
VKELDQRLAALGRTEIDHDLRALEGAVWARVDADGARLRPMPTRMAAAVCAVVAVLASGTGAVTAAAATRASQEVTAFLIHAPMAPSTIFSD